LTINKKIRNAQLAQWNYMLVVGQDEMDLGMVNVRNREGEIFGLKRVDEVIEMFKKDKPEPAEREKEVYSDIWRAEDYPLNEELYKEVLKKEAENAEKHKQQQEEKKKKLEDEKLAQQEQQKNKGKKGKKEKGKDEKVGEDHKEEANTEESGN